MKRHFDVIIIVPLEEEFDAALSYFRFVENLTTDTQIRFAVSAPESELTVLMIKQNAMGRTEAYNAAMRALEDFDASALVCVGIAGGLSGDVSIGDICTTGEVIDLLDNAKVSQSKKEQKGRGKKQDRKQDISFSPTFYETPTALMIAIAVDRLSPESKPAHEEWRSSRESFATSLIPRPFIGKNKKDETVGKPKIHQGVIACGSVADSPEYNDKVRAINRKILAIETESGGVFSVAKLKGLPALTVRGISDYAGYGIDKAAFERQTNSRAREVAASNAAAFLVRQLSLGPVVRYFSNLKKTDPAQQSVALADPLTQALLSQSERIETSLRDLAPSYQLQQKGYRLPVPRLKRLNSQVETVNPKQQMPVEFRDALLESRVVVAQLPPQYPDLSLAWIIGREMLLTQNSDRQVVPCIVEAKELYKGPETVVDQNVLKLKGLPQVELAFIVNDFNFNSKSRRDLLLKYIRTFADAKFLVLTRDRTNSLYEGDFVTQASALITAVTDVSFIEIAMFLQKNFEMPAAESEVVASRLTDTFERFGLPTHPTYFAGIPVPTLMALLSANRRAELIELAVAGYLSFVVSQDDEPISLSRTTREKFLTLFAYRLSVEGRTFSEADLASLAESFAAEHDFRISPSRFIASFIAKGLIYAEGGRVHFTLPFMQSFLLAKALLSNPEVVLKYFDISAPSFDMQTFSILAELGTPEEFIRSLISVMDERISTLTARRQGVPILVSDSVVPAIVAKQNRLRGLQMKIQEAIKETISGGADHSQEKQKLLDAARLVRENASRATEEVLRTEAEKRAPGKPNGTEGGAADQGEMEGGATGENGETFEQSTIAAWSIAVTLLGAGAERLNATTKRALVKKIVMLAALTANEATEERSKVDFKEMKESLKGDPELVGKLAKSEAAADVAEAGKSIEAMVDVFEMQLLTMPLGVTIEMLCEEAHDNVLAESISKADVDDPLSKLIRGVWLADIDVARGSNELKAALLGLPKAQLVRLTVANHLMQRVYWKQWQKQAKLRLLTIADECLKAVGLHYDKTPVIRMIDQESNP